MADELILNLKASAVFGLVDIIKRVIEENSRFAIYQNACFVGEPWYYYGFLKNRKILDRPVALEVYNKDNDGYQYVILRSIGEKPPEFISPILDSIYKRIIKEMKAIEKSHALHN